MILNYLGVIATILAATAFTGIIGAIASDFWRDLKREWRCYEQRGQGSSVRWESRDYPEIVLNASVLLLVLLIAGVVWALAVAVIIDILQ